MNRRQTENMTLSSAKVKIANLCRNLATIVIDMRARANRWLYSVRVIISLCIGR